MTPDRNERIREILANALERVEGIERDAYLTESCGSDAELRELVNGLLQAHRESRGFMRTLEAEPPNEDEAPGTVIGRYRLLEKIGEGGFGVVYMAEQLEPVRRKVALKIVKLGMDTREVIARFEAERQALAMMDHPNIAKILDAGVTGLGNSEFRVPNSEFKTGRPYFVMELVKGIPLTDYCDQQRLPTADRLQLFIQVCHAIHHAHQKGVIHRDLKPSNILVTLHDGKPVPKVIDFGVAKALGEPLTAKTFFTRFEQLIGTPAYMSPEQAALSGLDVDTRSDIYSLGVLLYELLTGTTPVQRETLRQAALDEIRRLIRETDPPKPSTRLGQELVAASRQSAADRTDENGGALTRRRCSQIQELIPLVRGDLDWIAMKALEKDRQRRYDSAAAFATDIEHHLNHEPVVACPPSQVYRARKFVRRHRVGVIAGSGILAALVIGLALALVGFTQARRQRSRAEKEAAIAKAVNDFLQKDLLEQADPDNEPDRDLKLRTALDRAAAKVQDRFTNQPLVEAAIRLTLSATYGGLGDYATAEAHAQRAVDLRTQALGAEHRETLEAREVLGWTYGLQDKKDEAERLWQALWQANRRVLGEEHTNTLSALYGLGSTYLEQERYAKAEEIYVRLADAYRRLLGPEHPDTVSSLHQLALVYGYSEQFDKAIEVNLQVLEARKAFGPEHPNTLTTTANLAMCYNDVGRFAEAIQLQEQVVTAKRKLLGPEHPSTLFAVGNLAEYYGQGCRWQPCAALCKEILGSTNAEFRANAVWGTPAGFMFKGAVASLLAGDNVSYRYFASELLDRFRATTNGGWARTVLEIDFLVPDATRDWATYLRLADLVQTNAPARLDAHNKLALGMLEFRRGRWDEALRYLEPASGSGRSPIASQAGCFAAMTYHQRGQSDAARAALAQASRRLAVFVRSGSFDSSTWHEYGRAAIARAEAERMILGQTVSELLTPASLEATRQAWAPVRQRLLEAQRSAAQGNWSKARDACLQAMGEPVFDWEAAEAAESWILAPKVGAVFVRAQDWTSHRNFCARLATYLETLSDPAWSRTYASICLIATNGLPPELVRKAVGWGRQGSADLDRFNLGPGMEGDRLGEFGLSAGVAAYRAGEYERALTVLVTEPNPKAVGIAGTVLAFRSMSLFQLGRQAEAREVLLQAENLLAQPLKNLTGDVWHRLAFAQTALEEARRLIGPSDKPREASE